MISKQMIEFSSFLMPMQKIDFRQSYVNQNLCSYWRRVYTWALWTDNPYRAGM